MVVTVGHGHRQRGESRQASLPPPHTGALKKEGNIKNIKIIQMVILLKSCIFWDITLCSSVKVD
jgi:hypothetical protein